MVSGQTLMLFVKRSTTLGVLKLRVLLDGLADDVHPAAFTAALLNYWGVGDNRLHTGILFLLLLGQRRLEACVGYGTARVFPPKVLLGLQTELMVPHLQNGSPGAALLGGVCGVLETFEDSGPAHWRRKDVFSEPNRHGFGGGQTPMDAFQKYAR